MLGPHFKEGSDLSTSSKVEIPLPEDDPQAIEIVCLIIHLRIDLVPAKLTHNTLLKVTRHCDKYGLLDVTRPTVQQWLDLRSEHPPVPISAAVDPMEAAFLFKCWRQIAKVGVLLVKHSTQDIVLLSSQRSRVPRISVHIFRKCHLPIFSRSDTDVHRQISFKKTAESNNNGWSA